MNEERLVLGCFDHKGLHHAATKLATMQHFFMLVLLYDLLRILLERDAEEVLKARANSMSLCLGSNLCTALNGCQSYIIIRM